LPLYAASSTGENAMIGLVVLLWACGIMPGSCAIPGETWLPTLRERLEHQQNAVLAERAEQQKALDAQRQQFLKRWLELRAKEKGLEIMRNDR
jgi:hypothetical protein